MSQALSRPTTNVTPLRPVLVPQTFDQLVMFAEMAAQSDLMPKDYKGKPANIMLAVQMGSELGLAPMQAVQSIAVINGRPGVWGDGLIGLCRQSSLCEDIQEKIEGEGEARTATCIAKRKGASPCIGRFSMADAKRAGLSGKQGPWTQYPDRMLQNRARGFALRDAFPDLLRGLKTVEELRDTPTDDFRGTTIDVPPEPAQPRAAAREDAIPSLDEVPAKRDHAREWLDKVLSALAAAKSQDAYFAVVDKLNGNRERVKQQRPELEAELVKAMKTAFERLQDTPEPSPSDTLDIGPDSHPQDDDFPGDRP